MMDMSNIVVFGFFFLNYIVSVQGGGIVQLRLHDFSSTNGTVEKSGGSIGCCDDPNTSPPVCDPMLCDPVIEICVSDSAAEGKCSQRPFRLPTQNNTAAVDYNYLLLEFPFFIWGGTTFVKVTVWDGGRSSFDKMVYMSNSLLVPTPGMHGDKNWLPLTVARYGVRLSMDLNVKCDEHFRDRKCVCEDRNTTSEHTMCDRQGGRVCLEGWANLDKCLTSTSICQIQNPCKNNAPCGTYTGKISNRLITVCTCPLDYSGDYCEIYTAPPSSTGLPSTTGRNTTTTITTTITTTTTTTTTTPSPPTTASTTNSSTAQTSQSSGTSNVNNATQPSSTSNASQPPSTQSSSTINATQPPSTQPPSTQPPSTQPLSTQPPNTQTPSTQHPSTQPPSTQPSNTQPSSTQPPITQPLSTQPSSTQPSSLNNGTQSSGTNQTSTNQNQPPKGGKGNGQKSTGGDSGSDNTGIIGGVVGGIAVAAGCAISLILLRKRICKTTQNTVSDTAEAEEKQDPGSTSNKTENISDDANNDTDKEKCPDSVVDF